MADELERIQRWGWLPLVSGCVVIAVATLAGWEAIASALGYGHVSDVQRLVFLARGTVTSAFLAAWVGWYVLRTRRRLERIRDMLRKEEARLAERAWRREQRAGIDAFHRIMAHEIKNPLNSISLHCAVLERGSSECEGPSATRIRESATVVRAEVQRLNRLVEDYLTQAKSHTMSLAPLDLRGLVDEVVHVYSSLLETQHIELAVSVQEEPALVRANAGKMRQVLHNLLKNAIEALPGGGGITIELGAEEGYATLAIADSGPGFTNPALAFRPFYTTKENGSGMGLAIVRDVIRAHGGQIIAKNRDNQTGAIVAMKLPLEVRP